MPEILEKLEELTLKTGVDFSSQNSFHHQVLCNLPDPLGAAIRFSALVSRIASEFSEKDSIASVQFYLSQAVFPEVAVLFSNSPILSRYLSKDPEVFKDIFPIQKTTVEEYQAIQKDRLSQLLSLLGKTEGGDPYAWIRREKTRQFLLIALSDYLGKDTFEETVSKISLFAETAIAYALEASGLSSFPVAVIAMGKLGGKELNYSSDIDIMFVTADDIEDKIDYQTLAKKINDFIDVLERLTADGLVFQVDLRIRPEGNQGQLYLSLKQYRRYYQMRAQSWEFQALIKARAVGGDRKVGEAFEGFRDEFVFTPDFSSRKMLFSIARIKNTIEKFHHSQDYDDVKVSPGGIRDLEFTVQFLQIHHGKITQVLKSSNTLSVLDKFLAYHLITPKQYRDFRKNYCFLRQIEHYHQLINLQPAKHIPTDPGALLILSRMMGFEDSRKFREKIKEVMDYNRNLFVLIFKLTVNFYEKIKDVRKRIHSIEGVENADSTFLEEHINHLESDYFLDLAASSIVEHIRLLRCLSENCSRLEISLALEDAHAISASEKVGRIRSHLVTYDHFGIFSLISALFSSHGISIQNGSSFVYQLSEPVSQGSTESISPATSTKPGRRFSSRLFWNRSTQVPVKDSSKKVVFFMEGLFVSQQALQDFDEEKLRATLFNAISQMEEGKYAQVMEGEILRSIKSMKKYQPQPLQQSLRPIQIQVDNESHPLYTLIDIESEDSFLFLFFFTYTLSFKGYYIVKVEFSTPRKRIRNCLFVVDKKRKKILSESNILDIKTSILVIKYFSIFMVNSPNPSLAYKTFHRLIQKVSPTEFKLQDYHQIFHDLAKVLGTGEAIMEDFLRLHHDDIQALLRDKQELKYRITRNYLKEKISELLAGHPPISEQIKIFNQFKDKYLFQIDLRLLTGEVGSFEEFCEEMSEFTDEVMVWAIEIALRQSREKFPDVVVEGEPGRHAIIALGKWGSREMGYASDVELVFVYDGPRGTDGKILSSVKEFYVYLGTKIPKVVRSKKNGVFELDLRLRPAGDAGMIAVSRDRYSNYYGDGGEALNYERMVLSRFRIVSDTGDLGKEILTVKEHFVYESGDFDLDDYFSLRQKQIENLVNPTRKNNPLANHVFHLKFSPGGLVEIEYLLQILSIRYGKAHPRVRENNTVKVADALFEEGLIDEATHKTLVDSYRFLRNLINCIRIIRGHAKDMIMPGRNSLEIEYLKRTMVNFHALEENQDLAEVLSQVIDKVKRIHNERLLDKNHDMATI